jgi:hypothetical protein
MLPSLTPTMLCHDRAEYRSPIVHLSCKYHRGTDCTSWKYVLGGNLTAVQDLINSCPVSCNVPCGAFALHIIDLSFIVSNISGLLDVVTQSPLENVAQAYLPQYVDENYGGKITFVLESVTLKSQSEIRRRNLRSLTETSMVQLRVVLSLVGYSIGAEQERLNQLLFAGIDSVGFNHALQISTEFYADAQATSAVRDIPRSTAIDDTNSEGKPNSLHTATIFVIATILAGFVVLFFFSLFIVIRSRIYNHSASPVRMQVEEGDRARICFSFSHSAASSETYPHGPRHYSMDSSDERSIITEKRQHLQDKTKANVNDDEKKNARARIGPIMTKQINMVILFIVQLHLHCQSAPRHHRHLCLGSLNVITHQLRLGMCAISGNFIFAIN